MHDVIDIDVGRKTACNTKQQFCALSARRQWFSVHIGRYHKTWVDIARA